MQQTVDRISYSTIEFDSSAIDQSLLNIDDRRRTSLFAWSGQFSPQLIEVLLNHYASPTDTVADPFLGSGTVLYECAGKNLSAVGVELNPSAYFMAKTYELCNYCMDERAAIIKTVSGLLQTLPDKQEPLEALPDIIAKQADPVKSVLSVLVVLLDLYKHPFTFSRLFKKWENLKKLILSLPFSTGFLRAHLGDSRTQFIEENKIDLVITSPPYINVFNYHQNYRRSVEALGYDILAIAKKEVGSNRRNRGNRFLTVIDYCLDMSLAIKDMIRYSY